MQIQNIMTQNPQWISPQTTLQEAAQQMQQQNVGSLLVAANDRIQGFVTDRDIAIRGVSAGKSAQETQVNEVMTQGILYCYEDQDATWAANNMHENGITRLAVLNRDKRLKGVVTHGDIARGVQQENMQQELGEQVTQLAAQQDRQQSAREAA